LETAAEIQKIFLTIHETLQRLTGLHRQLLDTVRLEREALVAADIARIEEATLAKQALIEGIRAGESNRIRHTAELAVLLRKPLRELTLPNLIVAIQGMNPKLAEQLRTDFNALTLLIKRIAEANKENQALVSSSLEHIQQMKTNILGESVPKSSTYTAKGQKSGGIQGSRLIHKEA
jgi:flagellar biosynthesis/type III secretory pathway chaperone